MAQLLGDHLAARAAHQLDAGLRRAAAQVTADCQRALVGEDES
jgi:hypothetical protein